MKMFDVDSIGLMRVLGSLLVLMIGSCSNNMLCIHQNQSSSFKGPISHSSSSSSSSESNIDLFQQFNCDDDFRDINLADFSIDVPLDDSLDQMFNNHQQHQHQQFGLSSSGYSTPTSSSLSTTTPSSTPTNSPIPSSIQLNLHQTSSSRLSNNNNNNSIRNNNEILASNHLQMMESTENSSGSIPTSPSSATLPSFMEIYSPRPYSQSTTPPQSLDQQQEKQLQSGLNNMAPDDGSSLFKFEIGDLNDDDNTSLSTVSFGSVSLSKSGSSGHNSASLQTALDQHHHRPNQQYHSNLVADGDYSRASGVPSSSGAMISNAGHFQHHQNQQQQQQQQPQYTHQQHQNHQFSQLFRQSPYQPLHNHQQQVQYRQPSLSPIAPMVRSLYQSTESSLASNTNSSGSNNNNQAASFEHAIRSQMSVSRSSMCSSASGSPNFFSLNSNIHGGGGDYSSRTSSGRSSPTEFLPIPECVKAASSTNGQQALSTFISSLPSSPEKVTVSSKSSSASQKKADIWATPSSPPGQVQQLCNVCGDSAACQHYGVRTCEGCKGFFKRTVQKGSKYVCLGNRDCPVDKRRRNRCQFCRFQKCLAVGMVKEVVRTDDLKGRRGRLPSKPKSLQESPPSPPVSLITAMVRAHVDTCPDISNLDHSQYREISDSESYNCNPMSRHQFINLLMSSMDTMKTFADKVPGFSELDKHDQELLYYSSCLEMISLRIAYQNKPGSKKIILPNGVVLHRNQIKLLFGFWFDNLELFSSRFAQIDIDISAFACLLGLTLITARHGLVNPDRVDNLQMKIIESLRDHVTYNAEAQKKSQYFSSVLSKLPDLRSLSMDGLTYLHELKLGFMSPIPESISRLLSKAL